MFALKRLILKIVALCAVLLSGACTYTSGIDIPTDTEDRFLACLSPGSKGACPKPKADWDVFGKSKTCPNEFISIKDVMTAYDDARIKVAQMDAETLAKVTEDFEKTVKGTNKGTNPDPVEFFQYGLMAAHLSALGTSTNFSSVLTELDGGRKSDQISALTTSIGSLAQQYAGRSRNFADERGLIAPRAAARMGLYGDKAFNKVERMAYDLQCNTKDTVDDDLSFDLEIGDARGIRDMVRAANQVNAFEIHPATLTLQKYAMALAGDEDKLKVLNAWERVGKFQKAYFKGYFRNGKFIKVNLFYDERRHLRQAYDDLVRRVANLDDLPDEVIEEIKQYVEGRFDDSTRLRKFKEWLERKPEDIVASLEGKLEKTQGNIFKKLKDIAGKKLGELDDSQRKEVLKHVEQVLFTLSKPLRDFLKTDVWDEGKGCGFLDPKNKDKKVSEIIKACFDFDKAVFDKLKSRLAGLVERFQTRVKGMLNRLAVPLRRLDEIAVLGDIGEGGYVNRNGVAMSVTPIEIQASPLSQERLEMNDFDYLATTTDLVRIFVEATFDGMFQLPGASKSTGVLVGKDNGKVNGLYDLDCLFAAREKEKSDELPGDCGNSGDYTGYKEIEPADVINVEASATSFEAYTSVAVSTAIRGFSVFNTENEAIEQLLETFVGTVARKSAELYQWCVYACGVDSSSDGKSNVFNTQISGASGSASGKTRKLKISVSTGLVSAW